MVKYYLDKAALVTGCGFEGKAAVQCIVQGITDVVVSDIDRPEALRTFLAKYDHSKRLKQPRILYIKTTNLGIFVEKTLNAMDKTATNRYQRPFQEAK